MWGATRRIGNGTQANSAQSVQADIAPAPNDVTQSQYARRPPRVKQWLKVSLLICLSGALAALERMTQSVAAGSHAARPAARARMAGRAAPAAPRKRKVPSGEVDTHGRAVI